MSDVQQSTVYALINLGILKCGFCKGKSVNFELLLTSLALQDSITSSMKEGYADLELVSITHDRDLSMPLLRYIVLISDACFLFFLNC